MLLRELGLVVYRWSSLELIIDGFCAYLGKAKLIPSKLRTPPRTFKERLKYIRQQSAHTALLHIRFDLLRAIDEAAALGELRNQLMHAVYSDFSNSTGARRTIIKLIDDSYYAVQDIETPTTKITGLIEDIRVCFAKLFNLHDRLKAIIRAIDGDNEIGRKARLDESRRNI